MTLPRGIRNSNPGNLIYSDSIHWQGQLGRDADGYAVFEGAADTQPPNAFWGIRAIARDLLTGFKRDHEDTVRSIIHEFAPPSENDTAAYIAAVCKAIGFDADEHIAPTQPNLVSLVVAIIHHENGQQPYEVAHVNAAVRAAMFVPK